MTEERITNRHQVFRTVLTIAACLILTILLVSEVKAQTVDDTESSEPETDPLLPVVISPTHPESGVWYSNNVPSFTWKLPKGVTGVSWLLHEKPEANPGDSLDGLVSEVSFGRIPDGITYFHIKHKSGDKFGSVAHYEVRTDTEPPLAFDVERVDDGDETEPRPSVTYSTSDDMSGIRSYRMRIGDGAWFNVPEASESMPYKLPPQTPGMNTVVVEASDGAGLTTEAELSFTVGSIPIPAISDHPDLLTPDQPFLVSGTAVPNSRVTVYARFIGVDVSTERRPPATDRSVVADDEGLWSIDFSGLGRGTYELYADSRDERGAVSLPSETAIIFSGSNFMNALVSLPRALLELPWWVYVLGIVVLEFLLWPFLFGSRRRKRGVVELSSEGDLVRSGIDILVLDIDLELATIKRLSSSRELYPEEKRLEKKLNQYLKSLKKIAAEGSSRTKKSRRSKKK